MSKPLQDKMSTITKYSGFINKAGLWFLQFYTSQFFSDVVWSRVSNSCLGTDRQQMNYGLEKSLKWLC